MKTVNHRKCPICKCEKVKILHTVNAINIVRCKECEMVFADTPNQIISKKNIYDNNTFQHYVISEPASVRAYYNSILNKIEKFFNTKKVKILDFGCGQGLFLREAKLNGFIGVGCDFSPYSQLAKEAFGLDIVTKNIFDTDFKPEEFDVIITHATHEHIADLFEVTEKLNSLLKKGGLFIISGVPNFNTYPIKFFGNFTRNMPPGHVNFFEKKTIKNLYNKLNIHPISIKTYGFSVFVWEILSKAKKILGRSKNINAPSKINAKKVELSKLTVLHRLMAKIYEYVHIPGMGLNIEIWGIKQ